MRLSVSNLAWPTQDDRAAFSTLAALDVKGIEVAPTRIAAWSDITPALLRSYRASLENEGLQISSLQAIFFGVGDASLLGGAPAFAKMRDHLRYVADLALSLGASKLVFGAPRNRLRGEMPLDDAWNLGGERLRDLGDALVPTGVTLGIEPVPAFYGGDFLTRWNEVLGMVQYVDHPLIRVHLDNACVMLGGDDIGQAVNDSHAWLTHVHAAQPELASFLTPDPSHMESSKALLASGYNEWIAIEMREQSDKPLEAVVTAVRTVQRLYRLVDEI
jgi:sugar phosphate isomerase/epimerase